METTKGFAGDLEESPKIIGYKLGYNYITHPFLGYKLKLIQHIHFWVPKSWDSWDTPFFQGSNTLRLWPNGFPICCMGWGDEKVHLFHGGYFMGSHQTQAILIWLIKSQLATLVTLSSN
jgi:hypothetical protein